MALNSSWQHCHERQCNKAELTKSCYLFWSCCAFGAYSWQTFVYLFKNLLGIIQITRFSYLLHASWPSGKQMVEKSKIYFPSFRIAPIYCPQHIPRQTQSKFIISGELQKTITNSNYLWNLAWWLNCPAHSKCIFH